MGFLVLTSGYAKTSASNENVPRTFLGTSIIIRIGLYAIYPMINKDIYIGPLIRQKVKERRLSINHFAAPIGCSRRRVYNIFEEKSIDIDLLCIISEVLDYNFLEEIYVKKKTLLPEHIFIYGYGIPIDPRYIPEEIRKKFLQYEEFRIKSKE